MAGNPFGQRFSSFCRHTSIWPYYQTCFVPHRICLPCLLRVRFHLPSYGFLKLRNESSQPLCFLCKANIADFKGRAVVEVILCKVVEASKHLTNQHKKIQQVDRAISAERGVSIASYLRQASSGNL